jgi:hypothetical protein
MKRWLVVLMLGIPGLAEARDPPPGAKVTYEKKTVISFEDDTISGDLTKPDGEYVESRKKVRHSNLIKIREEFKEKILQSAGEL